LKVGVVETSDLKLEIYSLTGRRVWNYNVTLQPGYMSFAWDGRNSSGETVGSGVYFVVLQNNGQKQFVRKVLVIK
jgi:flagellar hook assembly protein FlgD